MTRCAEHHAFNNPLITDDEHTRHATLTACYQLAQSVLKIGFALAKRWDRESWAVFSTRCHALRRYFGWLYKSLGWHWLGHFSPFQHKGHWKGYSANV